MIPLPASRTRDRGRRLPGQKATALRSRRALALVVSIVLLFGGLAILINIAPRARDYRLIAGGVDVHGTPTACTLETSSKGPPRAVLTLAYMSPGGRFTTNEHTIHAACGDALAEHREHRVLYAASKPGLALPLADAFLLRLRLIATVMGAMIFTLLGCWGLARLVRRAAKQG